MDTQTYWEGKGSQPEQRTCNLGLPWVPEDFDPFKSFDAQLWAASFLNTLREHPEIIIDHDLMVSWFANALMRGYEERTWQTPEYKRSIRRALHPWWSWRRYLATSKRDSR